MTTGYWMFLLMIIPVAAGVICYLKFKEINWWEALTSVAIAGAVCFLSLFLGKKCSSSDTETISGRIVEAVHTPYWHARWRETETYTVRDSKGRSRTKTRTVTKTRDYPPTWTARTTIGDLSLTQDYYQHIVRQHGETKRFGWRPNFDHGDRYDYHSYVKDDPEFCNYPVNRLHSWNNVLRSSNSIIKLKKIGDKEAAQLGLPKYPSNDHFVSSRLINENNISIWNWDKLNAALGERRRVNLIFINCSGNNLEFAKNIQAYWQNGKKNDLVLCRGQDWSYVFGWSKSELIKQNLMTILLDNPVNDDIIPLIKREVENNFEPHDWKQYDDLTIPLPIWSVILAFMLVGVSQGICFYFFHKNDY